MSQHVRTLTTISKNGSQFTFIFVLAVLEAVLISWMTFLEGFKQDFLMQARLLEVFCFATLH